ncbi:transposase [Streptomyces sp. NPDC060031]|uniref:transposase n=1 Tax=Streptomyces sp. NPDC060031 TaxID=3347043 RepID=UPI00367F9364
MAWQFLPPELGFGSGQTCSRRLERWQQAGVFDQVHRILLAELNAFCRLEMSPSLPSSGPTRRGAAEVTAPDAQRRALRLAAAPRRKEGQGHAVRLV